MTGVVFCEVWEVSFSVLLVAGCELKRDLQTKTTRVFFHVSVKVNQRNFNFHSPTLHPPTPIPESKESFETSPAKKPTNTSTPPLSLFLRSPQNLPHPRNKILLLSMIVSLTHRIPLVHFRDNFNLLLLRQNHPRPSTRHAA